MLISRLSLLQSSSIISVMLILLGIFISQPGLEVHYYGVKRILSVLELLIVSALCVYIFFELECRLRRAEGELRWHRIKCCCAPASGCTTTGLDPASSST